MVAHATELHVRLIYRHIAGLQAAAANLAQRRQAIAVRDRVTAELAGRGWRVTEIAAALQLETQLVRRWCYQGRGQQADGISLPYPGADGGAAQGAGRLSVPEVAVRYQVNGSTVRRWIKHGHLRATRASASRQGRWVIEAADLDQLSRPVGGRGPGHARPEPGQVVRVIIR